MNKRAGGAHAGQLRLRGKSALALALCWLPWTTPAQDAPPPTRLAPSELVLQLDVTLSSLPIPPVRDTPLELNEGVRLAVNRHPSIADAVALLSQQLGGVDVARAGYYPQIRAGVSSGANSASSTAGRNSTLATVSLSQMLYDFGKVDGSVSQAEAGVRRQQATILKQIDAVARDAGGAVVQAHRYQELAAIAREQVEAVTKVLEMTQLRAKAGISTKADPVQAQARVDAAHAGQLQAETLERQWNERLRTLIGVPADKGIASLPERAFQEVSPQEAPDVRLLPDVLIAEADRQAAQGQLAQAKAQRWPTVSLDLSANKALRGVNPSTLERDGTYHTVMVNLSSAVYQGGALNAQVRAATAAEEAARQRIETARLNAGDAARSFREQLAGAALRLNVLAKRKQSIAEALELYREQYKLGTRSILDLLNAEQEFYQARSDEEGLKHDLWQSLIGYIDAVGQSREFYGLNDTTIQGMEIRP
ncbi:MAG: TolC family outer membrane protein [Zoogloeaceae bacterium]|nr:TolC family outer membrane protein [Zoogloeaceae bacterium]